MNSDILPPLKKWGLAKYVKLYLSLLSCVDIVLFCHYNRDARKNKKTQWREANMGVLQVRVDDELKKQATEIFNELGIDLSTAVRMFLKKAVLEKGLPFDAKIDAGGLRMLAALEEMQKKSKENGNSEMTLDEINEEIRLAREERRNRKEVKWPIMQS